MRRPPAEAIGLTSQLPSRGSASGVRPGFQVRKPLRAQHLDQAKRIACAAQGLGRIAAQSMGS